MFNKTGILLLINLAIKCSLNNGVWGSLQASSVRHSVVIWCVMSADKRSKESWSSTAKNVRCKFECSKMPLVQVYKPCKDSTTHIQKQTYTRTQCKYTYTHFEVSYASSVFTISIAGVKSSSATFWSDIESKEVDLKLVVSTV